MDLLKFIFADPFTFIGVIVLLLVIFEGCAEIIRAIRKK